MNQVPPEVQAYVQQLVRSQTQCLDSPGASTEPNPTANILNYWALIMQQQQQQQHQQRSLPMPELATVLTALAQSGADPQQIAQFAPIFAAMVSKPIGVAAGQDADKAGVAGLRAAAQAQGGEAGEAAPAFTELAARATGGKAEADASASSSAPMQLDTAALFLQLACVAALVHLSTVRPCLLADHAANTCRSFLRHRTDCKLMCDGHSAFLPDLATFRLHVLCLQTVWSSF